jgi:hypothetical protein
MDTKTQTTTVTKSLTIDEQILKELKSINKKLEFFVALTVLAIGGYIILMIL